MLFLMKVFTLAYKLQPYAEAMTMRPDVSYIPCAEHLRVKTSNIIRFAQFEEGNLLSETFDNA